MKDRESKFTVGWDFMKVGEFALTNSLNISEG
jgi:hypothetical protein